MNILNNGRFGMAGALSGTMKSLIRRTVRWSTWELPSVQCFRVITPKIKRSCGQIFAFYCRYALFSNYCYSHTFSMGVQENTHIHTYTEQLRMLLSCTWQFWNRERQKNIGEQNVCVRAGGARVDEGAVWQQAGDVWSGAGEDSTHGSSSVCHWGTVRSLERYPLQECP